tara:strand:+ start:1413 stop:2285 length:873 start_codon:yes stop_codon:yes gene_type:complete
MQNLSVRNTVRGIYDIQKLRIQCGNRVVANFKAKLGQQPSATEDQMPDESIDLLVHLRRSHKLITEAIAASPRLRKFPGDELISDQAEYSLITQYVDLYDQESKQFKMLERFLRNVPLWTNFLKDVTGCGPAMAGVILSEIDIHKAEYPSSIHAYAGLDVASDGRGRSKRKEHLTEQSYLDSEGNEKTKMGITFNPFLKTKLMGVLGSSFIKQSPDKCKYRKIYDNYKHRLEHMDAHAEKSKGHRHNMATRYMIKMFLNDLYNAWRTLEGLPVALTYQEAKLGKTHKKAA